jgi:sterol desaturase/sphingolipid hydroxylase (fatty acid hydroxylase superfamily)
MELDPIILAIPIYFALIGLELIVQFWERKPIYRLNDALTNISCGITQQVTGVFLKIGILALYQLVYQHIRFITIEPSLLSYIALFILVDFCYYWAHRMSHEVSLFWGGHVVHHQSEDYNFSVALRQGSFQAIWTAIFYLPLAVIGFDTLSFVFINALVTIYQFWIHTEKIGKLGPLEWVFNTPSHHRVHHGRNPKYIDKNHAGVFIIWDRMFGTFQEEEERPTYGVTTPVNSWNPVWVNLHFYQFLYNEVKACRTWGDKLKTIVNKPGWRPDYRGGYLAPPELTEESKQKFNPALSPHLFWYTLLQYIFALAGTAVFLFSIEKLGLAEQAACTLIIIATVLNFGWLMENRRVAWYGEWFRLLATVALVLWLVQPAILSAIGIALPAYIFLSAAGLLYIRRQTVPKVLETA